MIADRVRTPAYMEALRRTIRPGSVVVEIGTGPGTFAVLACQLGASRVFAIESEDIIQVARENAAANGCSDRIEFFEAVSTSVNLPARADLIFSDLRGVLPQFSLHIPSIVDARRRFLAPGGVLVPQRDTVYAAIVEVPELYEESVGIWERSGFDQDLGPAHRLAVNNFYKLGRKPAKCLAHPQPWAVLDYMKIESPDFCKGLQWSVEQTGTGHGLLLWFDTELTDGVSISNAPGETRTIYQPLLFPWIHPVPLVPGQVVNVEFEAKLVGSDYVWRWTSQINGVDSSSKFSHEFNQSTLGGTIMSPARLRKAASRFVPQLNDEGLLDCKILEMMDGRASLEQIARRLVAEDPKRFASWQDALTITSALSRKYSR